MAAARRPGKPLLLFDGNCGFCRSWAERWRPALAGRVDCDSSQRARENFPEIPGDVYDRAVILLLPDGRVLEGAAAVFRALAEAGRGGPWRLHQKSALFAGAAEWAYRRVAAHRPFFSFLTRVFFKKSPPAESGGFPGPRPPADTRAIPILAGATGTGKTAVGLRLARMWGAEVISADSRQVYRRLSVGTSKPPGRTLDGVYSVDGVRHHLMDILEPVERYSAGAFHRAAESVLDRAAARKVPVLVAGGTGLYLRALADGLAPLPDRDEVFRDALKGKAAAGGRAALHDELARVDPAAAEKIPPNNLQRVIRALEVFHLTGRPLSLWQKKDTVPSTRRFRWFGLRWEARAYETHLADRSLAIARGGILEETEALLKSGVAADAPAFQSLGYRAALERLQGSLTQKGFEERLILETRQYAKRQKTWFRANARIHWIDMDSSVDPGAAAAEISRVLFSEDNLSNR